MCGLVAMTVASRSSGRRRANSSVVVPPLSEITSPGAISAIAAWATARLRGGVVGQALEEGVGPGRAGRQGAPVDAPQQPGVGQLLQIAAHGVERHAQPQGEIRGADLAVGTQPAQDELTALFAEQLPRGVEIDHARRIAQKAARSRTGGAARGSRAQQVCRATPDRRTASVRPRWVTRHGPNSRPTLPCMAFTVSGIDHLVLNVSDVEAPPTGTRACSACGARSRTAG